MAEVQEQIFIGWFNNYKRLFFKVIKAYAAIPEDQDDLFQEILLQLWLSIPNFQGGAKETTWIYRVALNTALVWKREKTRKSQRHNVLINFAEETLIQRNCGDLKQDDYVINQLYDAIRQLPKTESSLMLMHLEGLSYEEMADILGITISNVGVRLNRAKKNLAQLLKGSVDDL